MQVSQPSPGYSHFLLWASSMRSGCFTHWSPFAVFYSELPEGRNSGFEITVAPQYLPNSFLCKKSQKQKLSRWWWLIIRMKNVTREKHIAVLVVLPSRVWLFATPDCSPQALCPWDSPGRSTRVSCHSTIEGLWPRGWIRLSCMQAYSLPFELHLKSVCGFSVVLMWKWKLACNLFKKSEIIK